MSYQPEAIVRADKALELISEAVSQLSGIVVGQCHGHDSMDPDYRKAINESFYSLIKIRDELQK